MSSNKVFCSRTEKLLLEWDLQELIPEFRRKGINVEVLKSLSVEDIDLLIPEETRFGLRIIFKKKLREWKKQNNFGDISSDGIIVNKTYVDNSVASNNVVVVNISPFPFLPILPLSFAALK
ncbi:uncharacterized protein LOC119678376 [Teleopsis dalmanni]|uniref:uncharacterized protein LOC119678376 n=1 Tax=Teleopsis dalmanni TaxID=139649 RepID=UPI0018CD67D4|nr:uncharacterized protein LOC119678376 [Teleopsis dalmanni]